MFKLFARKSAAQAAAERARIRRSRLPEGERNWASFRAPDNPRDRLLAKHTLAWYELLPKTIRPVELCRAYPRVANRLALCWSEAALAGQVFDSLLLDKRGGRKGFPPLIAAELMRLRQYHAHLYNGAAEAGPWEAYSQATVDR